MYLTRILLMILRARSYSIIQGEVLCTSSCNQLSIGIGHRVFLLPVVAKSRDTFTRLAGIDRACDVQLTFLSSWSLPRLEEIDDAESKYIEACG